MLKYPEMDPVEDRLLSASAPWDAEVLHVYNDDYLGIRASASALPGRKLVLPNQLWNYREHLEAAVAHVRASKASRVVFHGMSNAVYETAMGVHRTRPRMPLFGVWHGGPSQWVDPREAFELRRFLELDQEVFLRSHIMKPGCNAVLVRPSGVLLVNSAPRPLVPPLPTRARGALVPGTPSMHKNIWGNLLAAELDPDIDVVKHYATLTNRPVHLGKSKQIEYRGPRAHQEQLRNVSIVLNASTMDCHPMVDLEAAALGRPSLHMNLHLGVLGDHPLEHLATVEDAASVQSIAEAVRRCLSVAAAEMFDMCLDYAAEMTLISVANWEIFLFGTDE